MKRLKRAHLVIFSLLLIPMFIQLSCKDEKTFQYNIDDLTDTYWGISQIIEVNPNITNPEITAPTVFYKDGLVEFEQKEIDYWRIYNTRSILIENKAQIWQILYLSRDSLHVNILIYPMGDFIMECLYTPMDL